MLGKSSRSTNLLHMRSLGGSRAGLPDSKPLNYYKVQSPFWGPASWTSSFLGLLFPKRGWTPSWTHSPCGSSHVFLAPHFPHHGGPEESRGATPSHSATRPSNLTRAHAASRVVAKNNGGSQWFLRHVYKNINPNAALLRRLARIRRKLFSV